MVAPKGTVLVKAGGGVGCCLMSMEYGLDDSELIVASVNAAPNNFERLPQRPDRASESQAMPRHYPSQRRQTRSPKQARGVAAGPGWLVTRILSLYGRTWLEFIG